MNPQKIYHTKTIFEITLTERPPPGKRGMSIGWRDTIE